MVDYTHLHVHTQYSVLDGASDITKLIRRAKELDMGALAITDHGNMYGALHFFNTAQDEGIKPILGCETYVADAGRFDRTGKGDRFRGFHLIILAKNKIGYHNLCKLVTLGFRDGFYYNPRIDKEILVQYKEGLIVSSACLAGEVAFYAQRGHMERAESAVLWYKEQFGEDFYLEVMDHGIPEQARANEAILALGKKHDVKVIATNDVHFIREEDAEAHDILVCLSTGKDFDDPARLKYTGKEYLKSYEEMAALFPENPEVLHNTQEIVDKVEVYELKRDILLPKFPIPREFENEDAYLAHLVWEGAQKVYEEITPEIKERLEMELGVISKMGFSGYFLITQDFINAARQMGILVGPGRGSAAGSAVAYVTGITAIDPIKYNLLFERFLNPERVSMPDIDTDFDDEERQKLFDYVIEKYGSDKVAQIVTFGKMAAKSAVRDVGRVLRVPLPETDRIAKLIPDTSLDEAFKKVPELQELKEKGEDRVRNMLKNAEILEGSIRQTGVHACGVIIGPEDLSEHIPLARAKDSPLMVTQYDGRFVESVGMLKMDFLGLKTLSIIKDAIQNIEIRHGKRVDIEHISLEDEKTYELYQRGDTIGTFQFESLGMQKYLKELKPTDIEDLITMNALYRPGPMKNIPLFIDRKHGRVPVVYPHEDLKDILKTTYGIMVYQEQIMQTAQRLGGFSLGKADNLRRAMGKKKMKAMNDMRVDFVAGAQERGIDKEKANDLFDTMKEFAEYGFNRSHSAAYSVVAYRTAYLKAHYPAEYMASVLTHNLTDIKKISFFIDECKHAGIAVLGPDINESYLNFTVNPKGEIRFGMAAIKGVGEAAVHAIILERKEHGPFADIFDLVRRVDLRTVNRKTLESLALAGAFDTFSDVHRAQFFHRDGDSDTSFIEKLVKHGSDYQARKKSAQVSLFGEETEVAMAELSMPEASPWPNIEQLKKEKAVTGFYMSGHPLDSFNFEIKQFTNVTIARLNEDLESLKGFGKLFFAGMITEAAERTTKKGAPYGFFVLEDKEDAHRFALFSKEYLELKPYIIAGQSVLVEGRIRRNYQEQYEVSIVSIELLAEVMERRVNKITMIIPQVQLTKELVKEFDQLVKHNKGPARMVIRIQDDTLERVEMLAKKRVDPAALIKFLNKNELKYKIN
ncbi:MAG: DNA polymerase III subunit alpha [Bacteroidetes bacterium]|nr:MAG: DNA polymerase III subunit alpha [Bacteroidota bacterium]